MKQIKQFFHILAITLIAMTCTLFAPTMVHTVEQERDIRFGFPVEFVSMNYSDFSVIEMEGSPAEYHLINPRQHPMFIIWENFWPAFAVWFIFANFLFILYYIFLKKYNRIFEILLTGLLFLFTIIAFFKFPLEIFIMLFITTVITQLLNEYVAQTKC
ncbi:hypothetical protein ACFL22_00680 [Patescibacteria group bacterium]